MLVIHRSARRWVAQWDIGNLMKGRTTPAPAAPTTPAIPDRSGQHSMVPRPAWPLRQHPPPAGLIRENSARHYFLTGRMIKSLFPITPTLLCPATLLSKLGYKQPPAAAQFWAAIQIPVIFIGNLRTPAVTLNYCTKSPKMEPPNQFSEPVNLSMTEHGITLRE